MRKQVATILGNMAHEIKQCDCKDPALGLAIKQATLEICQKFPKTVDNPDGYEPKPDEGRLLNRDSFEGLTFGDKVWGMIEPILKDQDAKTASIVRDEWRQKCEDLIATRHIVTSKEKDAECQERVERIKGLALQAIADEPEFPGDMPDELWVELDGTRQQQTDIMRNTVRLTKEGIAGRLQALWEKELG